jgi:PAS domain S-box-containing protein
MKRYLENKIYPGFGIALVILTLLWIYVNIESKNFLKTCKLIAHTHEVLYHLEQVLSITINIETGQRGYCLTKNDKFLQPAIKGSFEVYSHIRDLRQLVNDNPKQVKGVDKLEPIILEKLNFCNDAIELRRRLPLETVWDSDRALKGQALMDSIRKQIATMQLEEKLLLKNRTEENEKALNRFNLNFIGLFSLFFLLLVSLSTIIFLNVKALKSASGEIYDLYNNAPCGYHSINAEGYIVEINDTELSWLGYERQELINKVKFTDLLSPEGKAISAQNFVRFKSEGSIHNFEFIVTKKDGSSLNVILNGTAIYDVNHNFLKSRSTLFDNTDHKFAEKRISQLNVDLERNLFQLEASNKELEAFAYSVSHDLRAPLRSIDGYTRILFEDYNDKFDKEGRRILDVIMNNAKKMGQLIDDLLAFSRLGRTDLVKENINMMAKVEALIADTRIQYPDKKLEITLHQLMPSMADQSMIKQAWINLISNAVKYSQKREVSQIEIGCKQGEKDNVYYIKDNGVGFNMDYLHKLFGVFQRLHKMEEFEGTGVGLAIVHRIIARHGGKVWAEGKVNEGATFYFSLPKS